MSLSSDDLATRREDLWQTVAEARIDAMLITALPNVRYVSGFTGSNGAVLLLSTHALLFTDPRYGLQAPQQSDCEVKIAKGPLLTVVAKWIKRLGLRRIGFEETRIGFSEYSRLKEQTAGVRLRPIAGAIERQRQVKSPAEIETIRRSVMLNSAALDLALANFKPCITEAELAAEIEYKMRRQGAEGTAFETIVAAGPRTALPHAQPTDEAISGNQLLLVDMGARVAGYCSDMTRTYGVGKVGPATRRMYDAVLEAQMAAVSAVKAGVKCSKVDRAAREVLRKHKLERAFVHSTGHGLGLEIHEGPRLGRKEETKLEAGMVVTIEPGVYIEGQGGVRIEDTVAVTGNGCEVLTPTGKEFRAL